MDQLHLYFDKTILSWLIGVPFLGFFALLFTPRQSVGTIRKLSIGVMLLEFVLSLHLLTGDYTSGTYQYVASYDLVPAYGIGYTVGLDGISLWLVLLTTLMTPVALYASWTSVNTKVKEFALCFLFLEVAMVGAFVALDLFLFYVFWELLLVPMYLIIGIWGGADRIYATVKFFLYTMVGSLLMFVAILYVANAYHELSGVYSFDIRKLTQTVLDSETQLYLFIAFALAFAIKVPMFPLHTWLPDAHVQAPTGGSVILAAVLLKMGTYGFVRFAMPLFPLASHRAAPTLSVLAVIGIMYGAYCAWVQKDVKKLVAYSSVSHLGFVMLGLFSVTRQGVGGAVLQMVNHGISTGALFLLVGVIYERRHTRQLSEFGGLAKVMPLYTLLFVIVTMSSVGLPGTNGFIGEFMILNGAFLSKNLPTPFFFTLFASTGVILAAVYMLHAVLKMFWGPLDNTENEGLADVGGRELTTLVPLIGLVFLLGFAPSLFLDKMNPSVDIFLRDYDRKLHDSNYNDKLHLLKAEATPASTQQVALRVGGEP
ncbi:MAG: NADH-ubiquinone oxidoreductase chain [Myxococcaceae bacterium]|nr:NADH-ubiquinone oxidoreductase chain [Myxococcaceae bacterium]